MIDPEERRELLVMSLFVAAALVGAAVVVYLVRVRGWGRELAPPVAAPAAVVPPAPPAPAVPPPVPGGTGTP